MSNLKLPTRRTPNTSRRDLAWLVAALVASTSLTGFARAAEIEWVEIGLPGNARPTGSSTLGAVDVVFEIGVLEVSNEQWVEFLNAVAADDPNGLYNPIMGGANPGQNGGITRLGIPGSYSYEPIPGRGDLPVNWVSLYDAMRFANWLHNGRPAGAQDATTTEDGAYTITAQGIADGSIVRNVDAQVFVPTGHEWHKAAYHDAIGLGPENYFDYPTGSDIQTVCSAPPGGLNDANCNLQAVGDLTPVGSYLDSPSAHGTFDQGGNVFEWGEYVESVAGDRMPVIQGGAFNGGSLIAPNAQFANPSNEVFSVGFRVARVPEPGGYAPLAAATLALAAVSRRRSVIL